MATNLKFILEMLVYFLIFQSTSTTITNCKDAISSITSIVAMGDCTIIQINLIIKAQLSNHSLLDNDLIHRNLNPAILMNLPVMAVDIKISKNIPNWRGPSKTLSKSSTCHLVLININSNEYSSQVENTFSHLLSDHKFLAPQLVKNEDKFIFITEETNLLKLYHSQLIEGIKYSLVLTTVPSCQLHQFCRHCREESEKIQKIQIPTSSKELTILFPEFNSKYHGSTLKLSTTDKVPQIFELTKNLDTGKITAKRGLYASVLSHLQKGLNFTGELLISSGGGGTGTQLKNGTWVGIIGDLISQRADIGFIAAVTTQRYEHADLCAPVNYAFVGYVTGKVESNNPLSKTLSESLALP
jgi:hypothetical protein